MYAHLVEAVLCWACILVVSPSVAAQEPGVDPPKLRICISASSDRTRIQQLLPKITEAIAHDESKPQRGVYVVGLQDSAHALEHARSASCNYMLDLKIFQRRRVEFAVGGDGSYQRGKEEKEQFGMNIEGEIAVTWEVVALAGKSVDIQDDLRVHEMEYPLEDDSTAFDTVVSRATSGAAHAAIKKLKKTAHL